MAASDVFCISVATPAHVETMVDWARREGWNPGAVDARCFRAADPDGFLVGTIDDRLIATISAVRYPGLGFVGLYIVDPEFRGQGYGLRIWTAAMDRLDGVVTGLDGVVAQQDNYARSGFALAHRTVRFGGPARGRAHDDVEMLSIADLDMVADYDEPCFGAPRRAFLEQWLAQPGARALGVRSRGGLSGYGVIRAAHDGYKVGPLFADDAATAERILGGLAHHAGEGATLFWDVPEPNTAGIAIARDRGLEPVFETARMYRGGSPEILLDRVFGITTFELG
jgi:Acetyltransferase (GNAT) domain/Acetyltransferase (GNAT) family